MVETLVDSEELLGAVDVLAKVYIVRLVNIAFVHIAAQKGLKDVLGSADPQQVKHTKELLFGNVAVARDVVVLKDWLEVNALVFHRSSVLFKNLVDFSFILIAGEVFAAGKQSVTLGHGGDSCRRRLVNARDRECAVHVGAEVCVAEEALGVLGLVLLGQRLELVVSECKVHGAENLLELLARNSALPQLVKVSEELLNTDAFHYNGGFKSVFDI